jgi:tRNA pseudouridine13 synthase
MFPPDRPFDPLPERYLTIDQPGIGGRLKDRPEDFVVEEIPLYEPQGSGEHLYLWIEKRNRPTMEVVRAIGKRFKVPHHRIGYAGMKDKLAVTRQWISLHTDTEIDIENEADSPSHDIEGVSILETVRHRNKLRLGHLKGNRFSIRVRGFEEDDAEQRTRAILDRLVNSGVPNFVGEQRFGVRLDNHEVGRRFLLQDWDGMCACLLGHAGDDPNSPDYEARKAFDDGRYADAAKLWPSRMHFERIITRALADGWPADEAVQETNDSDQRFLISAFQSAVFNHVLARRIDEGTFDQFVDGDLACLHKNQAVFEVGEAELADPDTEARLRAVEISPTGPMFGHSMIRPTGRVARLENEELKATGVSIADFQTPPHDVPGLRRPLRQPVTNATVDSGVDEHGPFIEAGFDLPKGSFATIVMREVMKG